MRISIRRVFLVLLGAIGLLIGIVLFVEYYRPTISEQDLSFLKTQQRPLTAETVMKQLGHTEIGPGFYEYRIRGGEQTAEFWIGPPRPPVRTLASGFPVEIALVVLRSENAQRRIIWPENLKGRDFDAVLGSVWPQKQ